MTATNETVRAMTQGQLKDIVATLIEAIPDLTFDEAQAAIGDKGSLIFEVRKAFERFQIRPTSVQFTQEHSVETFTVSVQYAGSETIARLVKTGDYYWMNDRITDMSFPVGDKSGEETVELRVVHFNRSFNNGDEVIYALYEAGFIPAKPVHLLALGAAHKDLQRQFPIAALGQFWANPSGKRCVVYLSEGARKRGVGLDWIGLNWYGYWRFLALRK